MRAECSANRVALVRTRSINEIKTDLREQRSFRSIASLRLVGRSVGWSVGWMIGRSSVMDQPWDCSTDPSAAVGRLCHSIISSFMFRRCVRAFVRIFHQNLVVRAGSSLMRVITATRDSRGISLI